MQVLKTVDDGTRDVGLPDMSHTQKLSSPSFSDTVGCVTMSAPRVPPAELARKLRVFLPKTPLVARYLRRSPRFRQYKFNSFDDICDFLESTFSLQIEILYIGEHDINDAELDKHDYLAFFPIHDDSLRDELTKFVDRGIPFLFMRTHPNMECDSVRISAKQTECYRYRDRGTHCKHRFFINKSLGTALRFDDTRTILKNMEKKFILDVVPIFTVAFLIDFLIWYAAIGKSLKPRGEIRSELTFHLTRAISDVLAGFPQQQVTGSTT